MLLSKLFIYVGLWAKPNPHNTYYPRLRPKVVYEKERDRLLESVSSCGKGSVPLVWCFVLGAGERRLALEELRLLGDGGAG